MTPTLGELVAAKAPPVNIPFIFTDESGVAFKTPTDPFFGIGMLKISDAGRWSDELNKLLDRFVSAVQANQKKADARKLDRGEPVPIRPKFKRSHLEFKFAEMTTFSRQFYEQLVDFYVAQPDGYFSAIVVNKNKEGVEPIAACGTNWKALIKYTVTLLSKRIGENERPIIISDNYQKPGNSPEYYERQVLAGLRSRPLNALMIESSACVLLQLVDVLLGCVMYHYKIPTLKVVDADKKLVADRVAAAYGYPILKGNIGKDSVKPNHFDVWDYTPNNPIRAVAPAG